MKTILEQCRTEAMNRVATAIALAIADVKLMHGTNDPELSRYLAAALIDALLQEAKADEALLDRSIEILAASGRD